MHGVDQVDDGRRGWLSKVSIARIDEQGRCFDVEIDAVKSISGNNRGYGADKLLTSFAVFRVTTSPPPPIDIKTFFPLLFKYATSALLGRGLHFLFVPISQHHARTGFSKSLCCGKPQSGRGSCHEC